MAFAVIVYPVRQVIGVRVGIVQDTFIFHYYFTGVRAVAAGIPALWTLTTHALKNFHGFVIMLALFFFTHKLIGDPFISVGANFMTFSLKRPSDFRVTLNGGGHGEDSHRNVVALEQTH